MNSSWDSGFQGKPGQGMSHSPSFGGAASFFRTPYQATLNDVDIAVTGVPLDFATTNRSGARLGPRAIRNASLSLAWERPWPWTQDPLIALRVIDYGDCEPPNGNLLSVSHIESHIANIVNSGTATLILGGDHFISYPSLRAHAAVHGPISLIHFDAHTDTWPSESNDINHGTMFYHASREGIVVPASSTQIGIRTTNEDTQGFHIVSAADVHQLSGKNIASQILERTKDCPVYITVDIDCLDPAYAPGTGTPVPGGLSTFQLLNIIRELKGVNLVGMDIVEVAPAYDHAEITALAAAQIAIELLCLYAENHR
ncbi:agmatinase [Nitrosomonas sp.]|uniref:agmatinase n=1 Tax=Nitrosomonas sp. TaxID=42353 RepID=UPI001D56455D|nr:agmatinase [Nitrosomonas sp.]MCB1948795.1 agmatinase [Nitrosomonas sp.]